jgi:UDP-N-acetyl-D-mannosaminuronic acid dehydrogenase
LDLIASARRVNDGMVDFVVELLEEALGTLDGASVAVLGVAYKGNVDDARHSPGLRLVERLTASSVEEACATAPDGGRTDQTGVDVRIHDPHVENERIDLVDLETALRDADAAVVSAGHDAFRDIDPDEVAELMDGNVVLDGFALFDRDAWCDAGFDYVEI